MLPRPVRAVVFDMDGLLVDTEAGWRDAMMAAAHARGVELPLEIFLGMIGSNWARSREVLQAHFGPDFPLEVYIDECKARSEVIFEAGVCLKAGVVELLDHLDEADIPRAVATSSRHEEVERNLGGNGLRHRFHAVVAAGDYEQGKPHPDPFLKAAERLGVAPEHCLALEDSHNGVRAAHAAGMMTVMVPDLLHPTEEVRALCVTIADTLHHVRDLLAVGAAPAS